MPGKLVQIFSPQQIVEDDQLAQFRLGLAREEHREPDQRACAVMAGLKLLDAGVVFERIVAVAVIRPVNDHVPTITVRPQSFIRKLAYILEAHITGTPGATPDKGIR